MSSIGFPFSFNALAIAQPCEPVSLVQKTVAGLQEDEVLIRVSCASMNFMDPLLARRNLFNLPPPYVVGFDFSGEVVKLAGESADGLKVGAQVFGMTLAGGCFAEYVVAKREFVLPRGSVPAAEAAAFGIAYITAYESLVVTANIEQYKGKSIYVAGAAGGVGHFAAQIAKMYGLKVIGSAGKKASLSLLRNQLKLDHVIDYSKEEVVEEIMRLTEGKGVDVVYDSTYSQSSFNQSAAVVAAGGTYIRLGTMEQLALRGAEDMTPVVEGRGAKMVIGDAGRYSRDPVYKAQSWKLVDGFKQAVVWYEEGKVKPAITSTVPFDAAALQQAFDQFLRGTINVGKVVVNCQP